jgi:hypothetical protein
MYAQSYEIMRVFQRKIKIIGVFLVYGLGFE